MLAGFAENSVLLSNFTEPDAETIRIISARRQINMRRKSISYTLETVPSVDREELNRLAAWIEVCTDR
ncbi:hypothetical protein ACYULU_10105 [Breznakiellaceae bacterium SP9]